MEKIVQPLDRERSGERPSKACIFNKQRGPKGSAIRVRSLLSFRSRRIRMEKKSAAPNADKSHGLASAVAGAAGAGVAKIDAVTRLLPTETLGRGGIKNVRVLSESRFRLVLAEIVEEQVRERLASMEKEGQGKLHEEYRSKWTEFRVGYERKIEALEEMVRAMASAAGVCESIAR
jgi:hypothetical protein